MSTLLTGSLIWISALLSLGTILSMSSQALRRAADANRKLAEQKGELLELRQRVNALERKTGTGTSARYPQ